MRISIKETGGYAGLMKDVAALDAATLDAVAAQRIEQTVGDAAFFDLPNRVGEAIGSDLASYEVTVTDGDRQHTVSFAKRDRSPATVPVRRIVEAALQTA